MAINAQELQGQWNRLKGQVKEKWGQLTDDDLQISGGNVDQLVGRIQQKTGVARDQIEKFLSDLDVARRSGRRPPRRNSPPATSPTPPATGSARPSGNVSSAWPASGTRWPRTWSGTTRARRSPRPSASAWSPA